MSLHGIHNFSQVEQGHASTPGHETSDGVDMPMVRRLYDNSAASPRAAGFDLTTESLSVREQTANLSSRALLEGMNSSDPEIGTDSFDDDPPPGDGVYSYMGNSNVQTTPECRSRHASRTSGGLMDRGPSYGRSESSPLLGDGPVITATVPEEPGEFDGSASETTPLGTQLNDSQGDRFLPLNAAAALSYIPSVLLGVLLNILDGLSYGMILFPISSPVFAHLESVGLALFYVSTIVAQLVYSLGGSNFKACVGSEMIEIVPFFHVIATTISTHLAGEPREAILATTITAFAISALVTGMVFLVLGWLRLGAIVGFFPRHILVGCIGGVGFFLVATGVEVGGRLDSTLHYTWPTLVHLVQPTVLVRWGSCLALAAVLMGVERRFASPLMIPGILIVTFIVFYIVVSAVPNLTMETVRAAGWVFPAQESGEPWYYFYTLYRPSLIHIKPILETFPVMLALTFFGIIHVPINIPALAVATKNDTISVNRELVAHGVSNTLSGLLGGIQNYLVYTNSIMFIKSGADHPIAGIMLAAATFLVMMAGPVVIGYIPVIVVASLIFMMGLDLLAEALIDTWGTVGTHEYLTIVAIVVVMGGYDFVVGILVGIVLACLFFVITSARTDPIRSLLTGETAHSTVRRHPLLQRFLSRVGRQIYIVKLQGSLFFGTNVRLERAVRDIIDGEPGVKYLVVDLDAVTYIDYCTADTFAKLKRLLDAKDMRLMLSGASRRGDKIRGLRAVDLIRDPERNRHDPRGVRVFPNLNTALEACENELVEKYYRYRATIARQKGAPPPMFRPVPAAGPATLTSAASSMLQSGHHGMGTTPRATSLLVAAKHSADEDIQTVAKYHRFHQPFALLMQIVEGLSDNGEDFWFRVSRFFERYELPSGTEITQLGIVLVESGILHVKYASGFYETILAGTAYGELSFFGRAAPQAVAQVTTESPVVIWVMGPKMYAAMCSSENGTELARELLQVSFHIAMERFVALTQYITTAA